MKNFRVVSVVAGALGFVFASAGLVATAGEAQACGMSVRLEPTVKRSPVQEIARAEKALEAGQNLTAAAAVFGAFPRVRALPPISAAPLESRALRVVALALVRSNGATDEVGARGGKSAHPGANVTWAVQTLRDMDARRPNDPALQADLGEALAKVPGREDEAFNLLDGLATKDLMGSPFAYAALAKLRAARGDAGGELAAQKRCREMSRNPGICGPAPASPSAPPSKVPPVVLAKS